MTEKISVIIVTRNRAKMLSGCLESLVKQTRLPDEVVVVDNASSDNTKEVVLSFKKKLPIKYVSEEQVGIPYARNRGIKEASGTLLLMLDDDCEADKYWVERMENAHKKYPKAWVIQGRTHSLPRTKIYSLFAEFGRFLYLRDSAKKQTLRMINFFSKEFEEETELLICDTKNFSIKTSYLKKYNLSFDENFYRGSDTDLGKQILQKNGLIMFCPRVTVGHWERSSLKEFLKQQWQIGRAKARIGNKWKKSSFTTNMPPKLKGPLYLLLFCKIFNRWPKLPTLMLLLFLENLYRINGWFFEKIIISIRSYSSSESGLVETESRS